MSAGQAGPTAGQLVALVAEFIEAQILPAVSTDRYTREQIAGAADLLRMVERELLDDSADDTAARTGLARLGFADEAELSAAIRSGDLDHRADEVTSYLRSVVEQRLLIARPGYQDG